MRNVHLITKEQEGADVLHQYLYITSDEEIKQGDWVIEFQKGDDIGEVHFINSEYVIASDIQKKIILTDNPDLIAEGVQPIDNEFLEWFVKNPSCEFVEVIKEPLIIKGEADYFNYDNGTKLNTNVGKYKIIIPQEEPKTNLEKLPFPELVKEFVEYYENVPLTEEPKQELELKDFESGGILDVLNMGNVKYLDNGDIIYNPNLLFIKRNDKWFIKTELPKQETTLEDSIYQAIGLAANEQGIINQALATSKVMDVLKKTNL